MSKGLVCPIDINILPPRYRPRTRHGGLVFLLVLALGLALLPLYQVKVKGDAELGQIEERLKQVNKEMGGARQAGGEVKVLEDAITQATALSEAIERDYSGITDGDQGFVAALRSCFVALPPGAYLMSASEAGGQLILKGEAESTAIVIHYASILREGFPKVRLASLSKMEGSPYPAVFTIVINR